MKMKKKYRMLTVFLSMGIMLIGCVTFYIGGSPATGSKHMNTEVDADIKDDEGGAGGTNEGGTGSKEGTAGGDILSGEASGQAGEDNAGSAEYKNIDFTLQEDGEYVLEENKYPEVNQVVEKYLNASVLADMDTLSTIVSNADHIDSEALKEKYRYVEGYENISCYTIKSPEEGGYRVYVYAEIKLSGIDTLAPGLSTLYVTQTDQGDYCVYLDVLNQEVQEFIDKADESEPVKKLVEQVEYRYQEALSQSGELKKLQEQMTQ